MRDKERGEESEKLIKRDREKERRKVSKLEKKIWKERDTVNERECVKMGRNR